MQTHPFFAFSASDITCLVMMPLTTVNNDGTLNNASGLSAWMQQAYNGGVNGYRLVSPIALGAEMRHLALY